MKRELNKNEFFKVKRGYDQALELLQDNFVKAALKEIQGSIRLLEKIGDPILFLAKCYEIEAQCYERLNEDKKASYSIHLAKQIRKRINA